MLIKNAILKTEQEQVIQLIPKQFLWLNNIKKLRHNDVNLKTDYLINIMHELIFRYLTTNETTHNIWSLIFRKKYGQYYNYYIDWLVENEFMFLVSDYFLSKKARSYRLNITYFDVVKCKVNDKVLIKKYKKEFLSRSFTDFNNSPIDLKIREKLVEDLYHINIEADPAIDFIEQRWFNNEISKEKYYLNKISIENIRKKHIFFKFDEYGRLHTNFTILKKEIRNSYLNIDDEEICEVDIKNSQPFFFGLFLIKEMQEQGMLEQLNQECLNYIDLCNNGLIYNFLVDKFPIEIPSRDCAKQIVYKVLFGTNNDTNEENKIFKKAFPTILNYISEFKEIKYESYKGLSHQLQKLESDFIFGKVIKEIYKRIPDVHVFTVHDSIFFPRKYKDIIELIFNNELNKLKVKKENN